LGSGLGRPSGEGGTASGGDFLHHAIKRRKSLWEGEDSSFKKGRRINPQNIGRRPCLKRGVLKNARTGKKEKVIGPAEKKSLSAEVKKRALEWTTKEKLDFRKQK